MSSIKLILDKVVSIIKGRVILFNKPSGKLQQVKRQLICVNDLHPPATTPFLIAGVFSHIISLIYIDIQV
jgi:hypothetical protein